MSSCRAWQPRVCACGNDSVTIIRYSYPLWPQFPCVLLHYFLCTTCINASSMITSGLWIFSTIVWVHCEFGREFIAELIRGWIKSSCLIKCADVFSPSPPLPLSFSLTDLTSLYCQLFLSASPSLDRALISKIIHTLITQWQCQADLLIPKLYSFFTKAFAKAG